MNLGPIPWWRHNLACLQWGEEQEWSRDGAHARLHLGSNCWKQLLDGA